MTAVRFLHNLLEVQSQISGDDADVKQVLYGLKLTLLKVAEDIQALKSRKKNKKKKNKTHENT